MSEFEDILVGGEFAAFRATYAPAVHPAGPDAVRRTVRRRRRRTAVATAAAVVLAVVITVAANAALGEHRPPVPAESAEPTPSAPTPSPTPPAPPPSPSAGSPSPAAPDGRISRDQLLAARVELPAWPSYAPKTCTTDRVRLRERQEKNLPEVWGDLRYGDLDRDGATETVALVACRYGEALAKQVLAFDRDEAGHIVTMGPVIGTREGMADITEFSVRADGTVRVRVADIQPCCSTPEWAPQRQWRTYAWRGDRFTQTAGPTRFGIDPRLTDLTLTAGDLVLGPPDNLGRRPGSVTVTVVNKGPVDVAQLGFTDFSSVGKPSGGDVTRCRPVRSEGSDACVLDSLPAGGRKTYTFRFLIGPVPMGGPPLLRVIHYDSQEQYWTDLKPKDNAVELHPAG